MAKNKEQTQAADVPSRLIDVDSERIVLGNVLTRGLEVWPVIRDRLTVDDFGLESSRGLLRLLHQVADAGAAPSLEGCYRFLIDAGINHGPFGPLLSEVAFESIHVADFEPWLRALRRKAIDRRAYRIVEMIQLRAAEGFSGATEEIRDAREQLRELERSLVSSDQGGTIGALVSRLDGGLDGLMSKSRDAISLPWPTLTRLLSGGIRPGQVAIIAARPGVGKSTMALNIATHAARRGRRVRFFSLEMPVEDLLRRIAAAAAEIDHGWIVGGNLSKNERERVAAALSELDTAPLEIFADAHGLSEISARIASTKTGRCELAILDYVGLVETAGRFENRNQEVSFVSRRLKLLALDHGIPIVVLSQLNRASETQDRRPSLADLRDSGSLEQDADCVVLLHQPSRERKNRGAVGSEQVKAIVAKQRNGPAGFEASLCLDGRYCRLVEQIVGEQGDL